MGGMFGDPLRLRGLNHWFTAADILAYTCQQGRTLYNKPILTSRPPPPPPPLCVAVPRVRGRREGAQTYPAQRESQG